MANQGSGVYTARYAEDEFKKDNTLPKYYGVIKLLNNLEGITNREAIYKCSVTCMLPDGTHFQKIGETEGFIDKEINSELKQPYLYSVFIVKEYDKVFNELTDDELKNTFRSKALKKVLTKIITKTIKEFL